MNRCGSFPLSPPLWSKWKHARLSRSGPGFDPRSGQVSWVRFCRGFFSPVRQMSGCFRPPRSPNIIWPSLSSILIHYGRQWPEMLMCSNTQIYIHASSWFTHPTLSLACEQTLEDLKRSQGQKHRWGEWIWLTGPSGLLRNSPQGVKYQFCFVCEDECGDFMCFWPVCFGCVNLELRS